MLLWLILISTGLDILFTGVSGDADLSCWTATEGQHYTGLDQAPFNDLESCINHCLSLPQCSVIDIDLKTTPKCWVQKKIFAPTRNALKPQASVTNYMLDRACKGLLPAIDIKCWTVTNEMHYVFPSLDPIPIKDLASCLNHCASLPDCAVVDFDKNTDNKCWVQRKNFAPVFSSLGPAKSATNYMLDRSCLKPEDFIGINKYVHQCWTPTVGQHYMEQGLDHTFTSSLPECLSLCQDSWQCNVVDMDKNTFPTCWIQKKIFDPRKSALKPAPSAVNYWLNRDCYNSLLEKDLQCWVVTPQQHYRDPSLDQTSFNDLASCINYCNTLPQCSVIDMDTETSSKCWVQKKVFEPARSALKPRTQAVNYMLDKGCKALTAGVDLSCWGVTAGYRYTDLGLDQVSINDLGACLQKCIDTPGCGTVDFERATSPKCWIQKKSFVVTKAALKLRESSINFILNRDCVGSKANSLVQAKDEVIIGKVDQSKSASFMSCWMTRKDTRYSKGGLTQAPGSTIKECLTYCYKQQPSCQVVNFIAGSKQPCWILKSDKAVSLKDFEEADGVASYVYNSKCETA